MSIANIAQNMRVREFKKLVSRLFGKDINGIKICTLLFWLVYWLLGK